MIIFKDVSKTFYVPYRNSGMKEAILSFFKRKYRKIEALSNVSFVVPKGQIVGYLGPNGAGKSTTIKIMCGILKRDQGIVEINGLDPFEDRRKYVSSIGVVFGQRSQLWWDLPVIESYTLLKDIYKIDSTIFNQRLSELTELMNLGDLLHMPTRQLSLGQKMRCEVAASLLHNPKVLFLDEPTIGLDASGKVALRNIINSINKKYQTTIILTTHDMEDIEALAHRLLIINHGKLQFDGMMDEFRTTYSTGKVIKVTHIGEMVESALYQIVSSNNHYSILHTKCDITNVLNHLNQTLKIQDIEIEQESIESILLHHFESVTV